MDEGPFSIGFAPRPNGPLPKHSADRTIRVRKGMHAWLSDNAKKYEVAYTFKGLQ